MSTTETVSILPTLPPREAGSNKGNFGRVLVIAGSRGMSGAAVLCGSAALRGGAGLVKVAVPPEIQPIVAADNACYMTDMLAQDNDGRLRPAALPYLCALDQAHVVVSVRPDMV